jgi:hypothetical protein
MADCIECGKKLGFFNSSAINKDRMCMDCETKEFATKKKVIDTNLKDAANKLLLEIESVTLMTDYGHDLKILKRVETPPFALPPSALPPSALPAARRASRAASRCALRSARRAARSAFASGFGRNKAKSPCSGTAS